MKWLIIYLNVLLNILKKHTLVIIIKRFIWYSILECYRRTKNCIARYIKCLESSNSKLNFKCNIPYNLGNFIEVLKYETEKIYELKYSCKTKIKITRINVAKINSIWEICKNIRIFSRFIWVCEKIDIELHWMLE